MKTLVAAAVASSLLAAFPAFALPQAQTDTISKSLASAKVVDVPSAAAKLVAAATKESKSEVAVAAVTAAIKAHPSTVGSVIVSVLKVAPETTEAVVTAALEVAPQSALTIVAAAAEGAPDQAEKAVAIASAKTPARTAAFEREVAVVKGRRTIESAAITGGVVSQVGRTGPAPTGVYAAPGSGSNRP